MTTSLTPEERFAEAQRALAEAKENFDLNQNIENWHRFHAAQRAFALAKEQAGAVTHLAYH